MAKPRLCIICGGRSVEHEVSLQSARNVLDAVDPDAFDVVLVGIGKAGAWNRYRPEGFLTNADCPRTIALASPGPAVAIALVDGKGCLVPIGDPTAPLPLDVAFPVLHGSFGEDGTIQGLLEMADVPYVGCDVTSSAVCMSKDVGKALLRHNGIRVARDVVLTQCQKDGLDAQAVIRQLGLPLFVKPAKTGSSVGISKVNDECELLDALTVAFRYDSRAIIEEAIVGRELECSVLGNTDPRASVVGEVITDDFYSYEAKYLDDELAQLKAPADLDDATMRRFQQLAVAGFKALSCSGMARVDGFLTEDGAVVINEINTIPGFTNISMYPRLWTLSGMTYAELVAELIRLALERHGERAGLLTDFTPR